MLHGAGNVSDRRNPCWLIDFSFDGAHDRWMGGERLAHQRGQELSLIVTQGLVAIDEGKFHFAQDSADVLGE